MRFVIGLLMALGFGFSAQAATVFEETFQDELRAQFGGMPFEYIPSTSRNLYGAGEVYNSPGVGTGIIRFQPFSASGFYLQKSNVCPTACAVFNTYSSSSLRSQFGSTVILAPGQDYKLSIDLRLFGNAPATLDVAELYLFARPSGSNSIFSYDLLKITPQFETFSLMFTGLAGTPRPYEIGFTVNPRGSQSTVAVDNFRLETVSAVPLPAAGWMLIAAFGGLGALRATRRRAV